MQEKWFHAFIFSACCSPKLIHLHLWHMHSCKLSIRKPYFNAKVLSSRRRIEIDIQLSVHIFYNFMSNIFLPCPSAHRLSVCTTASPFLNCWSLFLPQLFGAMAKSFFQGGYIGIMASKPLNKEEHLFL